MATGDTTCGGRGDKGQPFGFTRRGGQTGHAYLSVPECGFGPGLLILDDGGGLSPSIRATCDLFAEEGYLTLAAGVSEKDDVAAALATLKGLPEHRGKTAVMGYGGGGDLAHRAAMAGLVDAAVVFDPSAIEADPSRPPPCPITFQFAIAGGERSGRISAHVRESYGHLADVAVHDYPTASPGFIFPGHRNFDKPASRIAHTRVLEPLRRELGPKFDLVAIFQEHLKYEFQTRDPDATMRTMVDEPYVNHVPTLTGGVGHDMLKRFYKYHFIPQNPADRSSVHVSYTVGVDRLVIETVASFTHNREIDYMFPGVPPTGRRVEIPIVLLVNFRGGKVCHEHIYWDQGSALAQLGLIDPSGLPISGPEQARKLLDEEQPSNEMMASWATSEGKPL